jgi:hypothetical protein
MENLKVGDRVLGRRYDIYGKRGIISAITMHGRRPKYDISFGVEQVSDLVRNDFYEINEKQDSESSNYDSESKETGDDDSDEGSRDTNSLLESIYDGLYGNEENSDDNDENSDVLSENLNSENTSNSERDMQPTLPTTAPARGGRGGRGGRGPRGGGGRGRGRGEAVQPAVRDGLPIGQAPPVARNPLVAHGITWRVREPDDPIRNDTSTNRFNSRIKWNGMFDTINNLNNDIKRPIDYFRRSFPPETFRTTVEATRANIDFARNLSDQRYRQDPNPNKRRRIYHEFNRGNYH